MTLIRDNFSGKWKGTYEWDGMFQCKFAVNSDQFISGDKVGMKITRLKGYNEVIKNGCIWNDQTLTGTCENSTLVMKGEGDIQFKGNIFGNVILLAGSGGGQPEGIDLSKKA